MKGWLARALPSSLLGRIILILEESYLLGKSRRLLCFLQYGGWCICVMPEQYTKIDSTKTVMHEEEKQQDILVLCIPQCLTIFHQEKLLEFPAGIKQKNSNMKSHENRKK